MRIVLLAGLALLVLAAGCGDDGGGGGRPELKGPVTYERGGGFAGRRDRLIVQPDGRARLTTFETTREIELEARDLDRLAAELERADLSSLPEKSTSPHPVPDAFGHRIQYGGSVVTTDDPAMPDRLRPLVGTLGGLVDRFEKR